MNLFEDKLFKNDPLYMKSLIGKQVKVDTIENIGHIGTVYVIDPIYKTLVLHKKDQLEQITTEFFLYHAIKSIEILSDEVDESYVEQKNLVQENEVEFKEKRDKLKKWLQQMYIEVKEAGNYLKLEDHLIISPPYGVENCISNNTIILDKIRNIINAMPKDFE